MVETKDKNLKSLTEEISTIQQVEKPVTSYVSAARDWYLSNFELFEKSLNGRVISPIHAIRRAAISRFAELGFPTTRDEEWRYTDVSPLLRVQFKPVFSQSLDGMTTKEVERHGLRAIKNYRLVFVNGHFSKELSSIPKLPAGVKIGSLAEAMRDHSNIVELHLARYARLDENAFTALNTAFLRDGVFVHIPDGVRLDYPIHLIFISTGIGLEIMSHPRNLVLMGKNTQATLIESHVSRTESTYFTNTVSEIVLGENSILDYNKLETQSDHSFHIGTTHVQQERNSSLTSNVMSFGTALVRNNLISVLNGEGAAATLNGLYLAMERQVIDNHTTIEHAKPHCESHELYHGILGGKSRGVFNGKIIVRKDAQKTDAKQTNRNLVLSDEAMIDTKPQLEIFANDVKCTHGATVGQLDEDSIFYLRSRGVGIEEARNILIYAFASGVINRISIETLRERLHEMLHSRLNDGRKKKGA